jgi:HPt (histidine-containing phosphotransfer) domain-containing protein
LPAEKDKAIACGFTAVLHKPFDSQKVFSIINTYLGTPVESNALSNVPDDANYLTDMHNLMLYAMQHDMQILEDAYLNADSQQLYILMHTHASRLAQFAYPALATLARKIELQLANGQLPVKSIQNYIQALKELLSVEKSYNV